MKKALPTRTSLFHILLVIAACWVVYTYRILIGPLIISSLFAYLLYPGVTWLAAKTKTERRRVVPVVYFVFLTILILSSIFLAPTAIGQFQHLNNLMTEFSNRADLIQNGIESITGLQVPIEPFIDELDDDLSQLLRPERVFRIIQGASTNIVWVIIIFITSFHLLRDWPRLREWLFKFSPEELEPDLRRLHKEIKLVWQTYLRGQLLIMAILGILSGAGAAIVGIPGALVLGFLAGTLALIPSLGPATATAIAALVAWIQGASHFGLSNFSAVIVIVVIFQLIQLIEGFWLTPRVMGKRLNLHPGVILVAVIGTLFTLGAVMALIVVPLLGSLDLILKFAWRKHRGLELWPSQTEAQPAEADEPENEEPR